MSIFNKICPSCAGENPVDESRCQCGFVFDASATTGSVQALEIAVQEAKVYAEYLLVRMNQAKETAEVAIAEQARSPEDSDKMSAADGANQEFMLAKTEYDEQMKIVAQLQRDAQITQDAENNKAHEAQRVKAEKLPKEKKVAMKKRAAEKKKAAVSPKKSEHKSAKAKSGTKKTSAPTPVKAKSKTNVGQASPPRPMRQKMANAANSASGQAQKKQPAAQKVIVADKKTVKTKPKAGPAKVKKQSAPAAKATPVFRAKQAAKADNAQKECPNCTAMNALNVKECKCGYGFATGAETMDGISLSDEDLALFSNLSSTGNS